MHTRVFFFKNQEVTDLSKSKLWSMNNCTKENDTNYYKKNPSNKFITKISTESSGSSKEANDKSHDINQ